MSSINDRPWRKIVHRDTKYVESASMTRRTFSWRADTVHTLTLECGHKQIRRGSTDPPKYKVICKKCEAGKEPVPLPEDLGPDTIDSGAALPRNPIARALIHNAVAKKKPTESVEDES